MGLCGKSVAAKEGKNIAGTVDENTLRTEQDSLFVQRSVKGKHIQTIVRNLM